MSFQIGGSYPHRTAGKQVTEEDQQAFQSVSVKDRLKGLNIQFTAPAEAAAPRTASKTWTRPTVQTQAPQCPTDLPPPCPTDLPPPCPVTTVADVATVILPPPPVIFQQPPSLPPRRRASPPLETEVPKETVVVLPPPPVALPRSPVKPFVKQDGPQQPSMGNFLANLTSNRLFQKASAEAEGEVAQRAKDLGYQYNKELQIFTNKDGDFLTLEDVIKVNSRGQATQQERDLAAATLKLLQELTPEHNMAEAAIKAKKTQEEADALMARKLQAEFEQQTNPAVQQQPEVNVQSPLFQRIIKAFEDQGFTWQADALCCTHANGAFIDAEGMHKMLADELDNDFSALIQKLIREAEDQ